MENKSEKTGNELERLAIDITRAEESGEIVRLNPSRLWHTLHRSPSPISLPGLSLAPVSRSRGAMSLSRFSQVFT